MNIDVKGGDPYHKKGKSYNLYNAISNKEGKNIYETPNSTLAKAGRSTLRDNNIQEQIG